MLVYQTTCLGNCNSSGWKPIWRVVLYQRYIVYSIYGITYLMVLVYVLSVVMMEYIISYREVCYIVNRLGIQFAALHRPNS